MPLLEGLWREVPKTGVQTLAIVVNLDVFENLFLRLLACRKAFSMDGLDLQAVVPALHGGVVVRVAFLTHAGDEAMGLQEAPIVMRAVLPRLKGCNVGRFLRLKACKMSRGLFGWPRERSLFEPETIPM